MSNLNDFLSDPRNMNTLRQMASSTEGQKLIQQLKGINKSKLNSLWQQINPNSEIDASKISQMANNPDLLKQINNYLSNNKI